MNPHRVDLGRLTRRTWLGLAAAGAGLGPWALAARAAQDDGKKAAGKGRIIATVTDFDGNPEINGLIAIDPEDRTWQLLVSAQSVTGGRLSPDGKMVAYSDIEDQKRRSWIADLAGNKPPHQIAEGRGGSMCWSPDSKQLVVGKPRVGPNGRIEFGSAEKWRMDADGSHATKLPLPDDQGVIDWSPDGQWLLTMTLGLGVAPGAKRRMGLVHPDGTGQRTLYEGAIQPSGMRFSPDGREVAYVLMNQRIQDNAFVATGFGLWMVRVDGEGRRQIPLGDIMATQPQWSPNGKRLALKERAYRKLENGDIALNSSSSERNSRIIIIDPDGKNFRNLDFPRGLLNVTDWR